MGNAELQQTFLSLVRLGIGTSKDVMMPDAIDWTAIKALSDEQGLTAVVLDGVNCLNSLSSLNSSKGLSSSKGLNSLSSLSNSAIQGPPRIEKLQWIGEVDFSYERYYATYKDAISSLAGFYNRHGFKMMVLKGYACSLDWPNPNHRPCGDIDIWLFGRQKEADAVLEEWFKSSSGSTCSPSVQEFKIDSSHHHHTVFDWHGFAVENHYDFINVHHHRSHAKLEKILKELGKDDSHFVDVNGERVYLPSPNLHALFLLKHAALHFVSTELTFRQVLDWAFFVEKHGKEVDWEWLLPVIEEHGMTPFLNIINAICVEELGFDKTLFPTMQCDPSVKDRVIDEVFASVYEDDEPGNVFMRQISRFRRWKGNAWKHELCYKESMWSAFWSGVWGHLLKPKSI